jgi:hypothetical protein
MCVYPLVFLPFLIKDSCLGAPSLWWFNPTHLPMEAKQIDLASDLLIAHNGHSVLRSDLGVTLIPYPNRSIHSGGLPRALIQVCRLVSLMPSKVQQGKLLPDKGASVLSYVLFLLTLIVQRKNKRVFLCFPFASPPFFFFFWWSTGVLNSGPHPC